MNAFTKVKGLVYPNSALQQQGRETHLQLESWSITYPGYKRRYMHAFRLRSKRLR